jgi:hypothetical protein
MPVLRLLFQLIFMALSALVLLTFWHAPEPDFGAGLAVLAVFIFMILLLGPWWPSAPNIARWSARSHLKLIAQHPRVAAVAPAAAAAACLYRAWLTLKQPDSPLPLERPLFALAGHQGVTVLWLTLATVCAASTVAAWFDER